MSTTVDERVVSMQFDNKHFESNVKTTMSTLEKFKQSLNLKGAAKGLEDVNYAAKKVDMSGLGGAVDTVKLKFSALEVMAVTALANITNSAINTGKRMVSALTIDPIKTGFNEYETKMNSIQTIMSNTASKGTTMEDVTRVIDELNTYADKTIYNFSEMTRNIGTFTAAGVGLEESAAAIQGIANLAAASGSNSQQASTAMYQLSQALATGTVKLMDWNSVVNAGMGGELFQNALKETARVHGVAVDEIIERNGSFRDSLHEEWLTADILTETLKKMTKSGAAEYLSNLTGISEDQINATQKLVAENKDGKASYDELAESMAATGKITKEQALNILKQADSAEDAATKVKTFTQLWDTLKESTQSGWGKTWELIFGNFEDAKNLFTGLSDFLGGFINKMNDARNALLEGALNLASPWTSIMEKLDAAGLGKIKEVADSIGNAADKLEYFQNVVNDVWRGDYKNADTGRYDLLKQAGYDDRVVQELVNKGYQYELTIEDVEAAHKKFGLTMEATSEETKELTDSLNNLSEEKLKEAGLTEEEIKLYMDLQAEAERTGKSVSELAEEMSKNDGRTLLIDSFKNAGRGLVAIFKALGEAWREIFPPMSVVQLYNIIKGINEFSQHLRVSDDTADKLKRTFKGVFAILDLVFTLVGGPLKIGFKVLTTILGAFDMSILDLTAKMGDAIVKFRDWIDENNIFVKAIKATPEFLAKFAKNVQKWITNVRETENLGQYIIDGLINGIKNGGKTVVTGIINFAKSIIEGFCEILGIHSPSRVFEGFGENIIQGLFNGLQNGIGGLVEFVKGIGTRLAEAFGNIDFAEIFSLLAAAGVLAAIKTLADAFDAIASPLQGLGELMEGAGEVMKYSAKNIGKIIKSFANVMNSVAFSIKVSALKNLAIGIAILVGCVIALTFVDGKEALKAVGIILLLSVILGVVAIAVSKLASSSATIDKNGVKLGGVTSTLISIGAALLLMAAAVKMLGKMDPEQYQQGFMGLIGMIGGMMLVVASFGLLTKSFHATNIKDFGKMLMKLSFSLLLLVGVVKLISLLTIDEMKEGAIFAAGFVVFIGALSLVTSFGNGNIAKLGGTILAISVALALLVGVVKLVNKLTVDEMKHGAKFAAGFVAFVGGLLLVCKLAKGDLPKLGGMLLAMSASMLLLIGVVKLVGQLNKDEMLKGAAFAGAFLIFVGAIAAIAKFAGPDMAKLGGTILAMSVAIGILAGICVLLGFIKTENLKKGLIAVGMLMGMLSIVLLAARSVQDIKGTLIGITACIAVLAIAIAGLSFIDPDRLVAPTIAMGALLGMFALVLKSSKTISDAYLTVAFISLAVIALGFVLTQLSEYNWTNTMGAAAALSMVLLAMVGALKIISTIKTVATSGLISLGIMVLIVGALGLVLSLLYKLPMESTLTIAESLSILLLAMSGALVILSVVGSFGPAAQIGISALISLITQVGILMVAIGALVEFIPGLETFLDTAIGVLEKIGYGLGSFVGNIIGGLAAGATAGLPEIAENIAAFCEELSGIDSEAITAATALADMILALTKAEVIQGIASFIPGVGDLGEFGKQLQPFGEAMVSFSDTISGKIDENAILAAANAGKMMADMAATIPGTGGVVQFFTGEKNMATFGSQLISFGHAIVNFSATVTGKIDEGAITAAANAGKTMTEMASTIPGTGGVVQFFTGEKDMATFGAQLVAFGGAITSFSATVTGKIDDAAVTAAANAGTAMTKMADTIPNTGGLVAFFAGDNDMATFGEHLVAFGGALVNFSETVEGIDAETVTPAIAAAEKLVELANVIPDEEGWLEKLIFGSDDMDEFAKSMEALGEGLDDFADEVEDINVDAVTAGANAAKLIVDMANDVDDVADMFKDEDEADEFSDNLESFGDGVKRFSDAVVGVDTGAVWSGTAAGKDVAGMAKEIANSGGIANIFGEGSNMSTFGEQLVSFAISLKRFAITVAGMDYESVVTGVRAGKQVAGMANEIANVGGLATLFGANTSMDTFGVQLVSFGNSVRRFSETSGGIDISNVSTAVAAGKTVLSLTRQPMGSTNLSGLGTQLVSFGNSFRAFYNNISTIDVGGVLANINQMKLMVESLKLVATAGINGFVSTINSSSSKVNLCMNTMLNSALSTIKAKRPEFITVGTVLMSEFVTAIDDKRTNVTNTIKGIITEALGSIKNQTVYNSFYSAGNYLVRGFANGISENAYKATAKARAMAIAARQAAEEALDVNSPSRVFYKIGSYVCEGFANALGDGEMQSYKAAWGMADSATGGFNDAISKIKGLIEGDLDVQPTIRPVLDLSEVAAGAGSISSLFNSNPKVGILSNLGSISAMMDGRGQNGGNDDVVSAIKDLKGSIDGISGDTYNVNGVTYDDGSNIATAVKEIVRAAKIERRV